MMDSPEVQTLVCMCIRQEHLFLCKPTHGQHAFDLCRVHQCRGFNPLVLIRVYLSKLNAHKSIQSAATSPIFFFLFHRNG